MQKRFKVANVLKRLGCGHCLAELNEVHQRIANSEPAFLMFLFFGKLMVDYQISMRDELCSMSCATNEPC